MRYLRLYIHFLRFSFSKAMEFRFDFFFRIIMDIVFYAVNLAFFQILFLHTPALGGWTLDQALVFTAGFMFVDAVYMTLFSNNLWVLPFLVNNGGLDYYLTRPVSSLFFLTFRDFSAGSFLNMVLASGILTWAVARYPGELGAGNLVVFVLLLLVGVGLHVMLSLIFVIPVFWMQGGMGMREFYYGLSVYMERPHQIFSGWVRRMLVSVLPLGLIASWPAHVLFEGFSWGRVLYMLTVVGLVWLILQLLWSRGLRSYASASS